jgi:AraC-like DNA-binding protein
MLIAEWDLDTSRPEPRDVTPSIRVVLDFIEENFTEPLALADLAALFGLSLHRFVTVFRQQVGLPPHRYLCVLRVNHARRLLRDGVPAASAAIDAGFCDQSHLARHFKRQCGMTPGRFTGARRTAPSTHEAQPCA